MEEVKEQIKLLEKERLLTEQERKYIIGAIENRSLKLVISLCCICFVLITVICVVLTINDDIRKGVIFSLILNMGLFYMFWNSWNITSKLGESIKKDEVYVKEAIYLNINKYHDASFYVMKNGRREIFLSYAINQDNASSGDKVILIQMSKKQVWIYKAREDEMQAD